MKLTSENVENVFMDCLFKEGEDTISYVPANLGITSMVGFHPDRLQSHSKEIRSMLSYLPEQFHEKSGGGWSFLNACNDNNGEQWTSLHQRMEQLFQLGNALGMVEALLPRELWPSLPGGMPYIVIKRESEVSDTE